MLAIILLAILSSSAFAAQSLSAGSGSATFGSGAPYNNVANFRIEFRIHGAWTYSGGSQLIWNSSSYQAIIVSGSLRFVSWRDGGGGSAACTIAPTAGTDVIVRFQRTAALLTCETFDAQTGVAAVTNASTGAAGSPTDASSTLQVGGLSAGSIAWVRTFITTLTVGTPPSNTTNAGTETDYELEGNGNDGSGFGANLTMSGASYATTPTYSPAAAFNPYPTAMVWSTSSNLQLTSTSFTATDNSTLTYLWSQVSPIPATGAFSSTTASNPTFSSSTGGTYGIQLAVTDSAMNTTNVSQNAGAVVTNGSCPTGTTNSNCIVNDGLSSVMHNIIGPLLIANNSANPWVFDDIASGPTLQNVGAVGMASPYLPALGSALTGTVTAGGSSAVLVGSGTSFLSQVTQYDFIEVAWNSADGTGTGRFLCQANTITDNTHITCGGAAGFSSQAGLTVYSMPKIGSGNICNGSPFYINCWTGMGQPNNSIHYYDDALALYRMYFRTGNTLYLTYAQQMADIIWQWVLDHGYGAQDPPRNKSMVSQYYRALELGGAAQTTRLAGLALQAASLNSTWFNTSVPLVDLRDNIAYPAVFFATGAKADATNRSTYCGYLTASTAIQNLLTVQNSNGSFSQRNFAVNPSYVDAPRDYVSSPIVWQVPGYFNALLLRTLEPVYEVLADTTASGCNSPTLAANLLTSMGSLSSWLWSYGRDGLSSSPGYRGIFYEMDSASIDQIGLYHPDGAATVAVTNGSTAVVGTGTHFLTYCSAYPFIGFETPRTVYKMNSCADDTHATLNIAYNYFGEAGNLSGSLFSVAPVSVPCAVGQSLATDCAGGSGDRNLTRFVPGALGWMYNKTGTSTYATRADEFYSATMGGPTSGLTINNNVYFFNLPCSGSACDGYTGDAILPAPTCGVPGGTTTPCVLAQVGGGATQNFILHFGKDPGEAWGISGIDNWLAWRLGAPAVGGSSISGNIKISGSVVIH